MHCCIELDVTIYIRMVIQTTQKFVIYPEICSVNIFLNKSLLFNTNKCIGLKGHII